MTFTFREGITLEQATDLAQLMDERLAEMNCLHLQLNPPLTAVTSPKPRRLSRHGFGMRISVKTFV